MSPVFSRPSIHEFQEQALRYAVCSDPHRIAYELRAHSLSAHIVFSLLSKLQVLSLRVKVHSLSSKSPRLGFL